MKLSFTGARKMLRMSPKYQSCLAAWHMVRAMVKPSITSIKLWSCGCPLQKRVEPYNEGVEIGIKVKPDPVFQRAVGFQWIMGWGLWKIWGGAGRVWDMGASIMSDQVYFPEDFSFLPKDERIAAATGFNESITAASHTTLNNGTWEVPPYNEEMGAKLFATSMEILNENNSA
ncbi:MAG: hypothetical protein R8J85_01620 [Mariprofundales bacterium]